VLRRRAGERGLRRADALNGPRTQRILADMKSFEFEVERTIQAPIEQVFVRLVDIEGHNEWMPDKGSLRKHSRQTSPGEPAVGTTYEDETSQGTLPGEIVELEAPRKVVYHWWDKSKKGKLKSEGWPGYSLEPAAESGTVVRHQAKLNLYGAYQLAAPIFKRFVVRERTVTIDALKASFEQHKGAVT
jgi:uncharacterized protein YndB with AHSA1/START domain